MRTCSDLGSPATEDCTAFTQFVRARSKYYAGLWKDVPAGEADLKKYPMVDHKSFWMANTVSANSVATEAQRDGVVFKTGGRSCLPR